MKQAHLYTATVLFAFLASSLAHGQIQLVESSTKTIGATTVTFDSSFLDANYTVGDVLTFTVEWSIDLGVGTFVDFVEKTNNPYTPPKSTTGVLLSVVQVDTSVDDPIGAVEVSIQFDSLHQAGQKSLGNAHYQLILNIDTDGDGEADSEGRFGVNVHVDDPVDDEPEPPVEEPL